MATDDKKWARNCRLKRVVILTRGLLGGCAGMRRQGRREDAAAASGEEHGAARGAVAAASRAITVRAGATHKTEKYLP